MTSFHVVWRQGYLLSVDLSHCAQTAVKPSEEYLPTCGLTLLNQPIVGILFKMFFFLSGWNEVFLP